MTAIKVGNSGKIERVMGCTVDIWNFHLSYASMLELPIVGTVITEII
ncbi:MAG: hypothetical protein OIN86_14635 [Candidatus Methanoperedens sp.]|nr:hypothetical protein [Candidatus Methanoperedens sp.]